MSEETKELASQEKEVTETETAEEKTENEDAAAENGEEGSGKKKAVKKKRGLSSNRIEILAAVFLGITALLTAWATWIGSLHGGNQATNYTRSNNLASEGNAAYNAAMQLYLSDMMVWNTALDYQLDATVARMKGNDEEAQIYVNKTEALIKQNCSTIMLDAMQKMTTDMTSPFEVEGVFDSYFTEANDLVKQSQELLEEGKKDNAHGDAYNLVNVIYSVVLFLLGIVGVFKSLPNRAVVLVIAIVGVILATIYMCTIPLPTGFNLLSFFGAG